MRWLYIIGGVGVLILISLSLNSTDNHTPDDELSTTTPRSAETAVTENVSTAVNTQQDVIPPTGKSLNLSNSGLTTVPKNVFDKTDLVSLNLSGNKLTGALPAEVRHLRNLQELNLSNNNFTGIPAEVGQLAQLRILNVSHNNLTGLPHELAQLKNLEVFDLRGNNPSTFDLDIIRNALPNTQIIVD
ncbi:MAG TPA: leucine-rich repeat domain-containing protein [Candidatus Paceibacterota bacterium]|nr:leucine-rich repeat domain-containing protein [Candidatus Paceibacterota bacterium]